MSAPTVAPSTYPVKHCQRFLGHAGAQVTPGGSVNSGAAFAWEALVHSDNHRCALRLLCESCHLVFLTAPVSLHLPLCYEQLF